MWTKKPDQRKFSVFVLVNYDIKQAAGVLILIPPLIRLKCGAILVDMLISRSPGVADQGTGAAGTNYRRHISRQSHKWFLGHFVSRET